MACLMQRCLENFPEMCNRRTKASIEMFDEPMDDSLWQLVALGAGTGALRLQSTRYIKVSGEI